MSGIDWILEEATVFALIVCSVELCGRINKSKGLEKTIHLLFFGIVIGSIVFVLQQGG